MSTVGDGSAKVLPERIGYRIVLPPGWLRIPLRDDPESVVDGLLEDNYRRMPHGEARDKYGPYRAELKRRMMASVAQARENEGLDLYLPVDQVHGATLPASFLVGLMEFVTVESPRPEDVLVGLMAGYEGARPAEVDGSPAIRAETRVAPVSGAQDETSYGSRRVDYVICVPDMLDTWLSVTFSTVQAATTDGSVVDPTALAYPDRDVTVSDVLVDLFDAIMTTWRWVRS